VIILAARAGLIRLPPGDGGAPDGSPHRT
jgi:hypothetical protein